MTYYKSRIYCLFNTYQFVQPSLAQLRKNTR